MNGMSLCVTKFQHPYLRSFFRVYSPLLLDSPALLELLSDNIDRKVTIDVFINNIGTGISFSVSINDIAFNHESNDYDSGNVDDLGNDDDVI